MDAFILHGGQKGNGNGNGNGNGGGNGQGIVQLHGLLAHFVCARDAEFYPFIIKGGLDWVCERILFLINLLMQSKDVPADNTCGAGGSVVAGGIAGAGAALNAPPVKASTSTGRPAKTTFKDNSGPPVFASSPSLLKPRQYHSTTTNIATTMNTMNMNHQSKNISHGPPLEEEIKKRLCILVDFCLRITILAEEKHKVRHEVVHNWLWRKEIKATAVSAVGAVVASAAAAENEKDVISVGGGNGNVNVNGNGNGARKISPLGSLLAASFILRNKNDPNAVITGEDYIMMPEKKVDRINWMLARMVDVNGEIMIVSKDKDKDHDKSSGAGGAGGSGGAGGKKRKRDENPSSGNDHASDDPTERLLSRIMKRQRANASNSEMPSSTARAILRAVTGGSGGGASASASGAAERAAERAAGLEGYSTAAEVMARTISLLDRGRDAGESSNTGSGTGALSSSLSRLMELRMGMVGSGGDGDGDHDEEEEDDDDKSDGEEAKNNEEHEHGEGDLFHAEEDEEAESDVHMEDSEEHDHEVDIEEEEDEDIESDDDEDRDEEGRMLDNIIVEVGSNPFQDDLVMVDELENIRSLSSSRRPLGDAQSQKLGVSDSSSPGTSTYKAWRSRAYLCASVEILEAQYPMYYHSHHPHSTITDKAQEEAVVRRNNRMVSSQGNPILTPSAEQALVRSICDIVKPPKKPLQLKVFMRRAPTQEEFFRGSMSRNPILISALKVIQSSNSSDSEPRVKDLRQHIANDLQMADSAELLELLVANKILDMNLKLRVVAQTLWRTHVMENASAVHSESSFRQFMSGSSFGESGLLSRAGRFDENTPMSELPPMVITYRLAGVDGEATEDNVEEGDLVDPDAPPDMNTSSTEYEKQMEKEYGITRMVTKGRGVGVLLRSLEAQIGQIMRRIRRDDIGRRSFIGGTEVIRKNPSRSHFLKSPPCSMLKLLQHCAMLSENRKKLVNAQAPTVLLRLLLDVLNSIDQSPKKQNKPQIQSADAVSVHNAEDGGVEGASSNETTSRVPPAPSHTIGNNPTADALQALIETLSSDISAEMSKKSKKNSEGDVEMESDSSSESEDEGESTLPMLLSSLRTTSLSPPLRKVIAKLLPFLTYGQVAQSRALAAQFLSHVHVEYLGSDSSLHHENDGENKAVLMATFVEAAIHLPPVAVCDTLRLELIRQGFVSNIKKLIISSVPSSPPSWSPALFAKGESQTESEDTKKQAEWKVYYNRNGLQTAFKILIGLSNDHQDTQTYLAGDGSSSEAISLITAAHWIESTSDKDDIKTNGLGILAETLLDAMSQNNEEVKSKIGALRKKTRDRKKELAQERRNRALSGMSAFGRLAGDGAATSSQKQTQGSDSKATTPTDVLTGKKKSGKKSPTPSAAKSKSTAKAEPSKPAWMLEMEAMEDESGLTCAVCQEGRSYQPSEMLGLYAYMKKISIPYNKGGGRGVADGTLMILSLPTSLPESLRGSDPDDDWYQPSLVLASTLKSTSHGASTIAAAASSVIASRSCYFITTVTAGNAIHCSCHARARTADRNHPKAPKSEWDGASLRNSRVSCNVILPLMSKENSKIPVMTMENALADHQSAVTNMLGSKPKSMLWTVLQDLRLLLLRMSYGEALNNDCGGGSLSSNSTLIFYSLFLADMFARDAEHDAPVTVQHAKGLPSAFLAASSILRASLVETTSTKKLRKGFADAGPMAAICCILFQNSVNDEDVSPAGNLTTENAPSIPPPKRRWELHKDHFLTGLLQCAGRRHTLGIDGSGCVQPTAARRMRSSSFSDWNSDDHAGSSVARRPYGKRSGLTIEEYAKALRPMITLYATLDQLSKVFTLQMDDENIEKCSETLVAVIESCQKAEDIRSLIALAKITLDDTTIIEELEAGMNTV